MNIKDRRFWTISFYIVCSISLIVVSSHFQALGEKYHTLETLLLSSTVAVVGYLLCRTLALQLKSEINGSTQLNLKYLQSLKVIRELDTKTRREISIWLHGDVQRQLMNLARILRDHGDIDLASEVTKLNDETVRAMAHRLHPQQLDISLELALSDLCYGQAELQLSDNLHLQTFIKSTFVILRTELRVAIYRIVEEGISNALKKPSTQKIFVLVSAEENSIDISVQDDGDKLTDSWKKSLGFSLISSYVDQFGGSWSISNNKDGVILRATLHEELSPSGDLISKQYPVLSQIKAKDTK
jgi:signal transduction histidine kinase